MLSKGAAAAACTKIDVDDDDGDNDEYSITMAMTKTTNLTIICIYWSHNDGMSLKLPVPTSLDGKKFLQRALSSNTNKYYVNQFRKET